MLVLEQWVQMFTFMVTDIWLLDSQRIGRWVKMMMLGIAVQFTVRVCVLVLKRVVGDRVQGRALQHHLLGAV